MRCCGCDHHDDGSWDALPVYIYFITHTVGTGLVHHLHARSARPFYCTCKRHWQRSNMRAIASSFLLAWANSAGQERARLDPKSANNATAKY
jgi:hypothetical protein